MIRQNGSIRPPGFLKEQMEPGANLTCVVRRIRAPTSPLQYACRVLVQHFVHHNWLIGTVLQDHVDMSRHQRVRMSTFRCGCLCHNQSKEILMNKSLRSCIYFQCLFINLQIFQQVLLQLATHTHTHTHIHTLTCSRVPSCHAFRGGKVNQSGHPDTIQMLAVAPRWIGPPNPLRSGPGVRRFFRRELDLNGQKGSKPVNPMTPSLGTMSL